MSLPSLFPAWNSDDATFVEAQLRSIVSKMEAETLPFSRPIGCSTQNDSVCLLYRRMRLVCYWVIEHQEISALLALLHEHRFLGPYRLI